ncbi:hypothetical protein JB92DRAFT_1230079 [Gautieria morchelliformis]|nr:hypothetical protein JB92DRAFT_1230079 [Gautieria morchelliformis]
MRRLLQPTNRILSMTPSKTACYISTLNIIQGDVDPTDVHFFFHITSAFHTLHTLSSPSAVLLCPFVCLSFQPAPARNSTPKSTNPSCIRPLRSQRNSCRQCMKGQGTSHKQLNATKAPRRLDRLGSTAYWHRYYASNLRKVLPYA